jgi:hypothetical protein
MARCSDCGSKISLAMSMVVCSGCKASQCSKCKIGHCCEAASKAMAHEKLIKLKACEKIVAPKLERI